MCRRCNLRPLSQSGSVVPGDERPRLLRYGSQRSVRVRRLLPQPIVRVVDVYEVSNELLVCETERRRSTGIVYVHTYSYVLWRPANDLHTRQLKYD
jgi:hypothetical protein